jgi:hypothetical protein
MFLLALHAGDESVSYLPMVLVKHFYHSLRIVILDMHGQLVNKLEINKQYEHILLTSIKFSKRNSKYFVYILQQLPSIHTAHVGNPT